MGERHGHKPFRTLVRETATVLGSEAQGLERYLEAVQVPNKITNYFFMYST